MPPLPPGQRAIGTFPRFGAPPFHERFPTVTGRIRIRLLGAIDRERTIGDELASLPRVEQASDFHRVTTWTRRDLRWSGVCFADVYRQLVAPYANADVSFVVLRGQDGYRSGLPLEDLLADDVLLADRLDGEPLTVAHGAPIRLVAPAHYGYKSVKHVDRIDVRLNDERYRPVGWRFMAHPRARVAYEERGQGVPGPILRRLYRPLIGTTTRRSERALQRHEAGADG